MFYKSSCWLIAGFLIVLVGCSSSKNTTGGLPNLKEGYVDADNGVQLFYRMYGSGSDTLVLIHGGPGLTMDYFLEDLAPLAENHTLIFYDQRGTGRSTLVSDSVGLDARRFVDDLEALRKHFNISRFNILGHSWGSAIVALYAMKYTAHLNKLIVVGTLPLQQYQLAETFRRIEAGRDSSTLRRMAELREARRADPGNAEVCRAYYELWFDGFYGDPKAASRSKGDFCAGTLESRRNKMQNVDRFTQASLGAWDWRDSLRAVNTPALIIHGTKDHLPREGAEAWASSLPNARLVLLEGIGHFPYLEAPDRFFSEVNSFLAK